MGRLFWKFFLFIWLAQMAGIVGTGALFWLERQAWQGQVERPQHPPPFSPPPPMDGGPPREPEGRPHRPPGPPPFGIPVKHIVAGLLASLMCAAGLAWYIAKPVRRLRTAFAAAAEGQLDERVAPAMGRRRDELADLGQDFDHMAERLRSLMNSQKRLLHDVSHELRSPLARLHAVIGLVRQQPERLEDSLQRIEREGDRMNRLVGELLTLSRLEAGVTGGLESVDLGELLFELVEDARFEAAGRSVTVNFTETSEIMVQANPEILHRAIENVVRNALRHSPEGEAVDLELLMLASDRCRIVVRDRGPGVPEAQLTQIFTPFFRGDEQREGYGLGLAIARRALLALGGDIRALNVPAGGLRVELELPVSEAV